MSHFPEDDKSMARLLLELAWHLLDLAWHLVMLVGPVVLVTLLPPWQGPLVVLGCTTLTCLCAWLNWRGLAGSFSQLTASSVIGLGLSLGLALPNYWNVLAALVVLVSGLAMIGVLERKLGITATPPADAQGSRQPATLHRSTGSSAWGGQEPERTPEGQPIRRFNMSEIAMGGPVYLDYLFPDGVLLQGIGSSARFSTDGRYFAATVPSRQQWGLVILDRQMRRVYHCEVDCFWELDAFTDTDLSGRVSPLVDNRTSRLNVQALISQARVVDMTPIVDIWIEPSALPRDAAPAQIERIGPHARHRVDGSLRMPASLRDLEQPLDALRYPAYQLSLDGRDTDLQFYADSPIIWRADGKALGLMAQRAGDTEPNYWIWQQDTGWQALPTPWVNSDQELSLNWSTPLALDEHHLRIEGYLAFPSPDRGRYGYSLSCVHGDTEIQTGHDALGRLQVGTRELTRVRLIVPLSGDGVRGMSSVESQPLLDHQRARLTWQMDDDSGLGGYRCQIADWDLPGLWRLDHRVSDCGRFLALIPFSEHAEKAVIIDLLKRHRLEGPPMAVANLLDFRAGRLSVVTLAGRLSNERTTTPLQRHDPLSTPSLETSPDDDFRDSRPYYLSVELAVGEDGVKLLPRWRTVRTPQAANADGDFVQPAADESDAAWLFGSETEYADSWLRPGSGRLGGHLLTASGCAIKDLAPSMIWSPDGRYLALTRLHADMQRRWELLLLDVQERTLRTFPDSPGNRPQFERFDHSGIKVRSFEDDWESLHDADKGRVRATALSTWLALPAVALIEKDGIWLLPDQEHDATSWLAMDASPLKPWR